MSKNDRGLRFGNPRAVLAYERYGTVYCKSMAEAMARYDIPSTSMLRRLIENGSTWRDGYTTFDWAFDDIHPERNGEPVGQSSEKKIKKCQSAGKMDSRHA